MKESPFYETMIQRRIRQGKKEQTAEAILTVLEVRFHAHVSDFAATCRMLIRK